MKRAIIDLSSVVWTCLLAGKDKEFGKTYQDDKGKDVLVNSAGFGYENAVNHLIGVMDDLRITPRQMIFVMEGMNSKQGRQYLIPEYKASRDRLPQQYEQFNLCKEQLLSAFLGLGAQCAWQDNGVEADDVIGYLALYLKGERWIVSGDKDLAQLVGGDIHHYRSGQLDKNPLGDFAHRLIPVYIALVGDGTDKIPGAKGFGDGAWLKMQAAFGDDGLEMMEELILKKQLHKLSEDVGELKELQRIIDGAEMVYTSYECGRLWVEKINTVRRSLQWRVGMVKPRSQCEDERLRKHGGLVKLITPTNYAAALEWARDLIMKSPEVTLDVETSTPPESDEWLEAQDKEDKVVDVFGSELTSLQMTFGPNMQYTVYLPVDNIEEADVKNLTVDQVRDFVDMVPRTKVTWVHNASFELPVCYNAWGEDWADDQLYHGFLRNVRDTAIASSYVDENRSRGLKNLSKTLLGYDQVTYDAVTTRTLKRADWDGQGKLLGSWFDQVAVPTGRFGTVMRGTGTYEPGHVEIDHYGDEVLTQGPEIMEEVPGQEIIDYIDGDEMVKVQLKMNQLTARHVLAYGADDCICTAAVANHFVAVMEIENTDTVFHEVETYPAYLTALAFVQGTEFSLESMREMEKADDEAYDKAWPVLRQYLMDAGFEGTVCPVITELTPANIKLAYNIFTTNDLVTQVRTPSKLAKLIRQQVEEPEFKDDELGNHSGRGRLLAGLIDAGDVNGINAMVKDYFKGEPKLDLASPKQMKELLYKYMKMPIRCINDVTVIERVKRPELADAVSRFKKRRSGASDITLTQTELDILFAKAKTDDTAIDLALAFDAELLSDDAKAALKAIGVMKKVMTRRSLFYKNYWHAKHWKDGRIHASANQCAAVTRRYSMSNPNLQQLPKKGEGVKFRANFLPHCRDAVVSSIDYVGQELRLAAEKSQDENMLACYVGDNLKDIHSITAAGAMRLKWGSEFVNAMMAEHGGALAAGLTREEAEYRLFLILRDLGKENPVGKKADDLRKDSKNVNFGAQNGAKAAKLAETLIMRFEDAELFLTAREKMFPDVGVAAEAAADEAKRLGYTTTFMGARRHLREAMMSDERGAADRAARQAWNFQIQGSAGEMTKMGMTRLWLSNALFKFNARFIAPVHDELVTSVHKDDAVEFLRIKHDCIAKPYSTMKVPVLGSISIGPNFAKQFECGDWFIEENIKKALNDIFKVKEVA